MTFGDVRPVMAGTLACLAFLSGCGDRTVGFRIIDAVDQDPYAGATEVRIALRDGNESTLRSWTFAATDSNGSLAGMPTGSNLSLVVEAIAAGRVLARGRSLPFSLERHGELPHPDVYLGRLGRFATPLASPSTNAAPLVVAATELGALIIDDAGDVYRLDIHDRRSALVGVGEPSLTWVTRYPTRALASYVALADGWIFGIGGTEGDAVLIDPEGRVAATLPASTPGFADHRFGAALAASGSTILVFGGASSDVGAATTAVTRIDRVLVDGSPALVPTSLEPLTTARRDGRALFMRVRGRADCPCDRFVLLGGRDGVGPRSLVTAIDPAGVDASVELDDPSVRPGAAAAPISESLLVLAGGRDAGGVPTSAVNVLVATVDSIATLSPSPPPLFFPRADAASIGLAPGLVFVVGGVTTLDAPSAAAELIEFPGSTLPTGNLLVPAARTGLAFLRDHTVLAVSSGSMSVYVPPRDL